MRYVVILGLLSLSFHGCAPTDRGVKGTNTTSVAENQTVTESLERKVDPLEVVEDSSVAKTEIDSVVDVKTPTEVVLETQTLAEVEPRTAWTTSRIQGSPDEPLPFEVEQVFDGLSFYAPVFIHQIPGTEKYLIGELCGRIYSIDKNVPDVDPTLVVDLFPDLHFRPPTPARGQLPVTTDNPIPTEHLYDLTFHPDFESNRQIILTYLATGESVAWASRMELSSDDIPRIDLASETRIISWSATGHNGGCVRFGTDGYLYISTGDGVGPNPPDANDVGQDISNLEASILRIDVDIPSDDVPYSIPSDNPFVDTSGARPEVWAYGFRNPWRMGFDRNTGDLWVADVGWETWEMVHHVVPGGNYGWPVMEGRKPLRTDVKPGPTPILFPVKDYPRSEANSVTGGIVYSGTKYPELAGWFIHGDYRTGHIWALKLDDQGQPLHRHLAYSSICIIAFTETTDGEIYILDHDVTGRTYRLIPSSPVERSFDFPQKLTETGLFTSVADLQPAAGVIPYQVTAEPWMDGADAERLLALPGKTKISATEVDGKSHWTFPEGTVFAQTVSYPTQPDQVPVRLETRVLHLGKDSWHAYSYRWNDTQTNATLVTSTGEQLFLTQDRPDSDASEHETWHISSRSECIICHRDNVGSVLGFVPAQLDRLVEHAGGQSNQLEWLAAKGVFEGNPRMAIDEASSLVDPHDPAQNLNDRARSYLDVNCGICHNPHGESISMFYLRRHYSLETAKAFKKPAIGTFNLEDPYLIAPGDPYRSIVLYRLGKLGNARMPYVASRVVDSAGFLLVHDWIRSLGGEVMSLQDEARASLQLLRRGDVAEDTQKEAISQLLTSTTNAFALLAAVRHGEIAVEIQDQIIALSQELTVATVRSLFEDFIPESQRRLTLGNHILPETILELTGDTARGKLIYLSDSSRCRICHVPDQQGQTLGADLKEIGKKYSKPELLRHIIEPSFKMEPAVTPYVLETVNGKVYSGLIIERHADQIVLQNVKREVFHIATDDVETLVPLDKSLMPERLLSDMTAQEAADLLEYLSTLRGDNSPGEEGAK